MEKVQQIQEQVAHIPDLDFRGRPIVRGKIFTPLKLIVYGDNGVGKTSFCANAKNPILWDLEGNSSHIEGVDKESGLTSLRDCESYLDDLVKYEHGYNTLIIDSLDSLETFFSEMIAKKYSSSDLGFGKSKAIWAKEIKDFMEKLNKIHKLKKMNILMTANRKVKPANNPMTEQYDRYDLRINEEMRTGFCTWAQCILLAMKDVIIESGKDAGFGKKKAKDIEMRVLYTSGTPAYYGKNVFDLPEKIKLDWSVFSGHVKNFYSN